MRGDSISDLSSIESGKRILIDHPEDCYWKQSEVEVVGRTELNRGGTKVVCKGLRGHPCALYVPDDRPPYFNGAAQGANHLGVEEVYEIV